MAKKRTFGIALILIAIVVSVLGAQSRSVAKILKPGRYSYLGSSYYMDLSRSDARGLRGTFNLRDRNSSSNYAGGTYTISNNEVVFSFNSGARGDFQGLSGKTWSYSVDDSESFSGSGERWRLSD